MNPCVVFSPVILGGGSGVQEGHMTDPLEPVWGIVELTLHYFILQCRLKLPSAHGGLWPFLSASLVLVRIQEGRANHKGIRNLFVNHLISTNRIMPWGPEQCKLLIQKPLRPSDLLHSTLSPGLRAFSLVKHITFSEWKRWSNKERQFSLSSLNSYVAAVSFDCAKVPPCAMPKDTENNHLWGRLASPPRHTSDISHSVTHGWRSQQGGGESQHRGYQVDKMPRVLARHLNKTNLGPERWPSG